MRGIPHVLLLPLRQVLMACDEVQSQNQLYALLGVDELRPFQAGLPGANSLSQRIDLTIGYLADKYRSSGENALVLFLRFLGSRYDPDDERRGRLLALADQIEWLLRHPTSQPEATALEANPAAAQMLYIADAEKMLTCARSVARIDVPRIIDGIPCGASNGTTWLTAPGLAITCWHVIEARRPLDPLLTAADLQAQVEQTVLRFDYTAAAKGLQYRVAQLEFPTLEDHPLDYAILRLADRSDAPVSGWGYLRLDIDAPLNPQTALYIIQHPLGQPQQASGDTYVRPSPLVGRILYRTPTEPGTSGAPVFNRINWRVIALHNGENLGAALREGTLLKAILADLQMKRPVLYDEIMAAQRVKE